MRDILVDSVDQSVVIRIVDETTGLPVQNVEHDTSGISLWYRREGGSVVAITPASLAAANSAHADGGIEHLDDGYYRLDGPDAAFATGAKGVVFGGTVTGMVVQGVYVPLVAYDPNDSANLGLTRLDLAVSTRASQTSLDTLNSALIVQRTTIASLSSQTSFTLTAGSADNNAYNDLIIVIEDGSTAAQKAVGYVSAYTGGSKTVTLGADPGIFTMANGDKVTILAVNKHGAIAGGQMALIDGAITNAKVAAAALAAASFAADAKGYMAQVRFNRDDGNTQDEYTVAWYRLGALVPAADITSPTIELFKRADGTNLKAQTALAQIGSLSAYKLDVTSAGERVTLGEDVVVRVQATIDGGTRTFEWTFGRDSTS